MEDGVDNEEAGDDEEVEDGEEVEGDAAQVEANRARIEHEARKYLAAQTHEVIIPSYSAWFDMSKINRVEERALPEFFNSRNRSKTPAIYKDYRDFMINTYRLRPRDYLTVTACRRNLAGDVCAIMRVHAFLEQWGLINYQVITPAGLPDPSVFTFQQVDPETRPSALGPPFTGHFRVVVDTPRGLQPLHPGTHRSEGAPDAAPSRDPTKPLVSIPIRQNIFQTSNKGSQPISAETASDLAAQSQKGTGTVTYSCDTCGVDCTQERYHSLKHPHFELCAPCYLEGRFSSKMFSGDFVRLTSSNTFKHGDGIHADDWTDAELLLLLEGIEMYDDDFNAVAEHVGTRTREQCVAQFLQLPIEDEYSQQPTSQGELGMLRYARVPFEKTDNPVMSVIAFLAGAVGPGVAAAAAQASVSELTESIKRKITATKQPSATTKEETKEDDETGAIASSNGPEPIVIEGSHTNGNETTQKSPSTTLPRSSVERAAAIALASASVKAKTLALHDDDQIRYLVAKITAAQRTKLELKLEQFEALEELMEEERRSLEEARQALHRERAHIASQLVELRTAVMQQRTMGVPPPPNFDAQFNALATSDVVKAREVTMQPGEYIESSNLTALS